MLVRLRVSSWQVRSMNIWKTAACAALPLLGSGSAPAAEPAKPAPAVAVLSKTKLPARGRQETILTVSRFGRYAITVQSEQGVSLRLVDRMAGPGEIAGAPGEKDGRLDLFLDRGDYKILAQADRNGTGTMTIAAHDFVERNRPQPP